jgi:exodeoxyribonuclease V alpha subunit
MATWSGGGGTVPGMQQTRVAPSTLEAVLERITYANQETGYTEPRVATYRGSDLLTVVGPLLGAQPGESLRLRGRWASHPQYGRQFQVEAYTTVLPATIQGIRRYLGSGLIKGIGPKMAERIVDHFGEDTLRLIEEAPGRLVEVPGLGPKRTAMIMTAWAEQQAIKEVMVFLQGVGVSTSLAVRIYKTYRDEAVEVVRREPYRLAAEVWGIGFKTADQLARRLGIPHDSPQRVKAGLQFALSQAAEDGHCYLPETELVAKATGLLEVEGGLTSRCLEELIQEEGVVAEPLPTAPCHPSISRPRGTGRSGWSRSTVPRSPWPVGCCACSTPPPTGWPASRRWTGRSRGSGYAAGSASPWPPSRRRRSGWL